MKRNHGYLILWGKWDWVRFSAWGSLRGIGSHSSGEAGSRRRSGTVFADFLRLGGLHRRWGSVFAAELWPDGPSPEFRIFLSSPLIHYPHF